MEHIHNTNNDFVFDSVVVSKPLTIQNGNFFMKVSKNGNPLYIQTPKCNIKQTKQDVHLHMGGDGEKTETLEKPKKRVVKRNYCDFIVPNDEEKFIKWFEDLEHHIQQKIYENHSKWFDIELELEDIEMSFSSTLKRTKLNKNSILRTNLPNLERTVLKIYNEVEEELLFDDLDDSMSVMSILEVQGIKYSARSFQVDVELKQMLVMEDVNIFDKCILKPQISKREIVENIEPLETFQTKEPELVMEPVVETEPDYEENIVLENPEHLENDDSKTEVENDNSNPYVENNETHEISHSEENKENKENDENTIKIDSLGDSNIEFQEIELDLDEIPENEKVEIKQQKTIYYEMYKEARRKAKVARDLALSSYLEAKRIKTTYMLDDNIDSDESSIEYDDDEDSDDDSDDGSVNQSNETSIENDSQYLQNTIENTNIEES